MPLGTVETYDGEGRLVATRTEQYVAPERAVVELDRLGVGRGVATDKRQPHNVNVVIDGAELTSPTPSTNKVGSVNAVTIRGDFTGEPAHGVPDPTQVFGANDYILSGDQPGDFAGIDNMWGRLSEVHLKAPGAALTQMFGLSAQSQIEVEAAGATVDLIASLYATGPVNNAGATVDTAASLFVLSPAAGAATDTYAIYQGGTGRVWFNGPVTAVVGLTVRNGALTLLAGVPLVLTSPNGTRYEVSVSDGGTLGTTPA